MKADGKLLFSLGCPKNKIKLFVGKEFDNEQELIAAFSEVKPQEQKLEWHPDCAFLFLKNVIPYLPMEMHGEKPIKCSNSTLKRWLNSGSILINGSFPKASDIVIFPIQELIFFPNTKRKTTYV